MKTLFTFRRFDRLKDYLQDKYSIVQPLKLERDIKKLFTICYRNKFVHPCQLPTDFIPQTFCRVIFLGAFGRGDAYGIHQ